LAGGLNCEVELIERLLGESKLAPTARAQELDLGSWERLYRQAAKRQLL
jgi:hypothetical protein